MSVRSAGSRSTFSRFILVQFLQEILYRSGVNVANPISRARFGDLSDQVTATMLNHTLTNDLDQQPLVISRQLFDLLDGSLENR